MAAMHWQLRHAVPAPDCDMTTAAFMGLKRAALLRAKIEMWGDDLFRLWENDNSSSQPSTLLYG